jgi:hypothetical protein
MFFDTPPRAGMIFVQAAFAFALALSVRAVEADELG